MAWNTKQNGKQYFYLTERLPDGSVRKKYYGRGAIAEVESKRLEQRKADREAMARERARIAEAESLLAEQTQHTEELVTVSLLLAGFHNPKWRGWRKKMTNANDNSGQPQSPSADASELSMKELIKAAQGGDESVVAALREAMHNDPKSAVANLGDMAAKTQREWIIRISGKDLFQREVVRMRLDDLKQQLQRQSNGTAIEHMLVDLVASSWLQLYYHESREAVEPAEEIRLAELRLKKIESAFKRHTKALATLATVKGLTPSQPADEAPPGIQLSDHLQLDIPPETSSQDEADVKSGDSGPGGSADQVSAQQPQPSPPETSGKSPASSVPLTEKKSAKKKKSKSTEPQQGGSAEQSEPPVKKPK